jgi:hypothetical protein
MTIARKRGCCLTTTWGDIPAILTVVCQLLVLLIFFPQERRVFSKCIRKKGWHHSVKSIKASVRKHNIIPISLVFAFLECAFWGYSLARYVNSLHVYMSTKYPNFS